MHPQRMEVSTSVVNPPQTTRTDLDEPILRPTYAGDQQRSPPEVEMLIGGDSREIFFGESRTGEAESQMCVAQELTYKNTTVDITSPWAQSWRRHDIDGGEVFYHPQVSLIVELHNLRSYQFYWSTS